MDAQGPLLDDTSLIDEIISRLRIAGYADDDIQWSENCGPPSSAEDFAREAIFVICNSGMKAAIAVRIFQKCMAAIDMAEPTATVFGHKGKTGAIDHIWANREALYAGYMEADDKITFCQSLPWIGGITCYHLAKNFGAQVAKPDVHLVRLAERHRTTSQDLCEKIAAMTGYKVNTVDLILWRACAERILDGRTSTLVEEQKAAPSPPTQVELFAPVQQELFSI